MIFPFKITDTNTEIINTNTNSHDWDELNPTKKKKKNGERGEVRPWGRERVTKWGPKGGGWVKPWEGGWLAGCEMGDGYGRWAREIKGAEGCATMWDRRGRNGVKRVESCAWLLVTVWVKEPRDEEG